MAREFPEGSDRMRQPPASIDVFREVMDIRQASDYLGISPDTLYKYASEGVVPAFKLGNRWRFKRSRLDEWMDQQSVRGDHSHSAPSAFAVAEAKKPQSVRPRPKKSAGGVP